MSPHDPHLLPQRSEGRRKILIVDHHPVFRLGLATLLEGEVDFGVYDSVGSGPEALTSLRKPDAACDAVTIDISLPGANGLELLKQIHAEHPTLPMMVVTAHDEQLYALRALRAGALGYFMKRERPEVIIAALRKVLASQITVSGAFGEELIYKMARGHSHDESPLDCLSDRQLEVLDCVGAGKTTGEIANALHLSSKTIESHRLNIKQKLGFKSASELVRFAIAWRRDQFEASPS